MRDPVTMISPGAAASPEFSSAARLPSSACGAGVSCAKAAVAERIAMAEMQVAPRNAAFKTGFLTRQPLVAVLAIACRDVLFNGCAGLNARIPAI
jgi:hypothetical protein